MPLKKYRNEKSLKEDFKYLKTILQMRTRPNIIDDFYIVMVVRANSSHTIATISLLRHRLFTVFGMAMFSFS